jgi:dihydropyrimidine dehydrogenase (NAD+) subunit PreT
MSTNQVSERPGLTLQQAIEEAHRCLLCHDAPCSSACPGATDPGKFIRQIRFFNLKGAARTVMGNNPLGGVCSYVCPTDDTCVGACVRTGIDHPIDIDGLQRFAAEYGQEHGVKALEKGEARSEKVAVVGGGPAGLSAAAHLAEYGYQVTIFEKRPALGGMLRYGVPDDRLSDQELDADLNQIMALGVEVRTETEVKGKDGALALLEQGFDAVFVAPGLWRAFKLNIPGIKAKGVSNAVEFLDWARSDLDRAEALVDGKNVVIIGGGSVAMDVANTACKLGANRVHALALESMTELPAQTEEIAEAFDNDVVIKPQCMVAKIKTKGGKVIGVKGVETEWKEPGSLAPSNARAVKGSDFTIPARAIIQAIGQRPSKAARSMVAVANKRGALLEADGATQATSVPKVFAGGDIVRGAGTVVAAVGDGKRAARAIHELLTDGKEVGNE